jgi:hypothetical protein
MDWIPLPAGQPQPITVTRAQAAVVVGGWPVDPQGRDTSAAVVIAIGARRYPALYGADRRDVAERFGVPAYRFSGFERAIPVNDLPDGVHPSRCSCSAGTGTPTGSPAPTPSWRFGEPTTDVCLQPRSRL